MQPPPSLCVHLLSRNDLIFHLVPLARVFLALCADHPGSSLIAAFPHPQDYLTRTPKVGADHSTIPKGPDFFQFVLHREDAHKMSSLMRTLCDRTSFNGLRAQKALCGRKTLVTSFLPAKKLHYHHSTKIKKASDDEDSENFWTVEADDTEFWDAYVSTRPNYSPSFYKLMYKHHAEHSRSYAVAHDVGCGAGQVTAELASRFSHVVASDNILHHLAVAKRRLTPLFDSSRVSYTNCTGEDLASHHPAASVDMIAAAEAIVLMDADAGLRSFATLLKSGGTLATWFYGRPTFSEPGYFNECQPILDKIMVRNWTKVIRGSGPKRMWGFKRCADGMESWLDFVRFRQDTWLDVQRLKFNPHGTLPFFGEEACGFDIEPVSHVAEREKVVVEKDPEFWMNEWDMAA